MNTVNVIRAFFTPLLLAYPLLLYFGTYLSIIFIGNLVSFTTLWLAFQGNLEFLPFLGVIALVLFADISGDLAWYFLGKKLSGTRFGHFLYNRIPHHREIEEYIQASAPKLIFLSKFIPGSTFAIIFSVGWAKTDFKKFFPISLAAIMSSVSVLVLLAFGLASSLSALTAASLFKRYEHLVILAVVLFLIIDILLGKLFRRALHYGKRRNTS